MLDVGDRVPDFTTKTTEGKTVRLFDLRGKRLVFYFFPKAFTKG